MQLMLSDSFALKLCAVEMLRFPASLSRLIAPNSAERRRLWKSRPHGTDHEVKKNMYFHVGARYIYILNILNIVYKYIVYK